jgi:hypothetical protein
MANGSASLEVMLHLNNFGAYYISSTELRGSQEAQADWELINFMLR